MSGYDSNGLVQKFLDTFQITVKANDRPVIEQRLQEHIDAVIYNIASMAVVFTLVKDKNKIQPKYLEDVTNYVAATCPPHKGQSGGAPMASDYFGYPHPNYSASNAGSGTVMSEVGFADGVARAGLDSQMGGASPRLIGIAIHDANAKLFVRSILRMHDMQISQSAFKQLLHIIDIHLNCMGNDLIAKLPLTVARLTKVLTKKRHAVFH